jgi:hypothetical protein
MAAFVHVENKLRQSKIFSKSAFDWDRGNQCDPNLITVTAQCNHPQCMQGKQRPLDNTLNSHVSLSQSQHLE